MNCFDLFKMIFYVFDNEYNNGSKEIGDLCSSMNPFLFEGEGSAVPDLYEDFKKEFATKFNDKCTVEQGYEYGKLYAKKIKIKAAEKAFENITLEDWKSAYKDMN